MYWLFAVFQIYTAAQTEKTTINIYAITTSFSVGESLERGHEIAIDVINDDPNILPTYYLNLTILRSGDDSTQALLYALDISYNNDNDGHNHNISYDIPIVLGCDWSSLSTVTAPTLSAFEWAQISSSSTSVILSETSSFSYFYRTITNDDLQAQSLIYLCNIFNWTQIGIIHVNDNYGVYLAVAISELATSNSIEVNSIAFERNKNESYINAVASMREIGTKIIIIISHGDNDIKQIFKALNQKDMLKYPYFYIATDGWLDAKVIQNISRDFNDYQGIIGTLPWQPLALNESDYIKNNLSSMYKEGNRIYTEIEGWYEMKYGNDSDSNTYDEPMGTRLIYGYDSTMAFVKTLQKLDDKYGLKHMFNNIDYDSYLIGNISDIILNDIEFESVTGLVSFDNVNGDRDNGLYGFGYITAFGEIEYFGYSYFETVNNSNGTNSKFIAIMNESLIIWPNIFTSKDIIPRSTSLKTEELSTINEGTFILMAVIASIGIAGILCYIFWIICKSQTWRNKSNFWLNMMIYTGAMMAYLNMIFGGLDEREHDKPTLDIFCNIYVWFLVISFTLLFTPIFAKTYKLSRIFTELLINKEIPDSTLLIRVFIAICIDLLLLIIFVILHRFERVYREGFIERIDELQEKQYIYGVCTISNPSINYAFFVCIGVYKLIQLIFGIYVSIIVSRMSFKSQIWIMSIIVVIFCIDIILIAFGPTDEPNFTYLVFCVTTILIINIILFEKWIRRLRMRWDIKHNVNSNYDENDIILNDERKMKKLLKLRLQEIAKAENWASEMSVTNTTNTTNTTNDDNNNYNQQNGHNDQLQTAENQ